MVFIITVIVIWIDNIVLQYGVFFWNCFSSNFSPFYWKLEVNSCNYYYFSFWIFSFLHCHLICLSLLLLLLPLSLSLMVASAAVKSHFVNIVRTTGYSKPHVNLKPHKVLNSKCFTATHLIRSGFHLLLFFLIDKKKIYIICLIK